LKRRRRGGAASLQLIEHLQLKICQARRHWPRLLPAYCPAQTV